MRPHLGWEGGRVPTCEARLAGGQSVTSGAGHMGPVTQAGPGATRRGQEGRL